MLLNLFQTPDNGTFPVPPIRNSLEPVHPFRSPLKGCILIPAVCILLSSRLSTADEGPDFQSGADVGVVVIDDDVYVSAVVEQRFKYRGFSIILRGPFRLRISDQSPSDSGTLRRQDWDQPSDFARIVPHVAYGRTLNDGYIDLFAGELNNVTVGTGSAVSHFFNSTDMDRYKGGLSPRGEYRGNGLALILDDVVAPAIFAGQAFIAPAAWFTDASWARKITLGFIFGTDFKAPLRAYEDDTRILTVMGGGIRGMAVENENLTIEPSINIMAMDGDPGVHAGSRIRWIVSRTEGILFSLYGEYRYSGSDYQPALFNPFYNFNRFHYVLPDAAPDTTFADQQSYGASLPNAHGLMFDFSFNWQRRFQLGAVYDRTGNNRPHWVMFYTNVSPVEGYQLRGFFAGQDLSGGRELFGHSSIFGLEARGRIWKPLDLFFYFTRRWRDIPSVQNLADEFGGGLGAAFSY